MMKYFFVYASILLSSALFSSQSYAQLKYNQGFIINHDQDTITGQVGIKKFDQYYKYCYFKEQNSKKTQKLSPLDIFGFGVKESLCFVSVNEGGASGDNKKIFAQLLVGGKTSLLKSNNLYYLYLENKLHSLEGDYKKTLSELMSDCKSVKYDILLTNKEDTHLSRLVESYNECIGSSSTTYHYEPKNFLFRPTIGIGVYTSQLNLTLQNKDGNNSNSSSQSQGFQGGIGFDFMFTKFSKKISFSTGFYYQRSAYILDFKNEIEPYYSSLPIETIYEETTFSHSSVQLPIMIKYNIPIDLWNFYIGTGFTFYFNGGFEYESLMELEKENVVKTNTVETNSGLRIIQQGLIFVAGLDRILSKNICLGGEVRAELSNALYSSSNDYYDVNSKSRRLYFTIFYKF